MKNKIKKFLIIVSTFMLLTGCAQERILEQLGIITAIGLDKGEEEREVFGSFVTYKFSQQLSNESTPIYSYGRTARDAYNQAFSKTAKQLVTGQLRAVLMDRS